RGGGVEERHAGDATLHAPAAPRGSDHECPPRRPGTRKSHTPPRSRLANLGSRGRHGPLGTSSPLTARRPADSTPPTRTAVGRGGADFRGRRTPHPNATPRVHRRKSVRRPPRL